MKDKELMKEKNCAILADTLSILNQGYYYFDGKKVDLKLSREQMESVKVFLPEEVHMIGGSGASEQTHDSAGGRCELSCENIDSFSLARKRRAQLAEEMDREGAKPILVLNLANSVHAGGGVRRGSMAQEEDLCRKSSLLLSLESRAAQPYYNYNKALNTRMGSDGVIITPHVEIIKDENGNLLKNTEIVAVMTCAAPNLRHGMERLSSQEYKDMMQGRINGMLLVAAHLGYEYLILGAFGCGAFRNDAHAVSDMFYKALKDNDSFRRVDFAVMDHTQDQYNYKEFNRNFN